MEPYPTPHPTPPHPQRSNDEGAAAASSTPTAPPPEATPEVWDRVKALLRSLPAADSLSRSPNSLEKEAQVRVWAWVGGWVGRGVV